MPYRSPGPRIHERYEGVQLAYSWLAHHLSVLAGLWRSPQGTGAKTRMGLGPAPSRGLIQLPLSRGRPRPLQFLSSPIERVRRRQRPAIKMLPTQLLGQPTCRAGARPVPNGADIRGVDAYSRFGLDAGAQFEVAQRVEAVLGERTVRIDAAAQDQADLIGDQTPKPGGPFVPGQRVQFGKEFACAPTALPRGSEQLRRMGCVAQRRLAMGTHHRGVARVGAVVAQ